MTSPSGHEAAHGAFHSTQWSMVLAARDGSPSHARAALSSLCSAYWRPLYLYIRHTGRSIEDAQDMTQSFFAHLLEKDSLQHVDPSLGKFRAFLLVSLKNFLANERRHRHAQKRGGGGGIVSLDEMMQAESASAFPPAGSLTPERLYERTWAWALLATTTSRLEAEFAAAGRTPLFQALKPYLAGDRAARYAETAAALEMSEVTVRVSVHRMRGRFRDLLQHEVAQTLADPFDAAAVEQELRFLLAAL
jgi:RNA polymerase sigma-70 factor (ECF subfamily)